MENLSSTSALVVSQKKELGEILTGFETKNKYAISDASGQPLYVAAEEGGSLLLRWFLKGLRPFTMGVYSEGEQAVLRAKRPFRFYFHRLEVVDAHGESLGVIERRFSLLRRVYAVLDASGKEAFELFGPLLHPWTFHIRRDGQDCGKIVKKFGGLLKEGFTDADTFGIVFPQEWDVRLKALFLGAVFLMDFVHFENTGNN